MAESFMQTGALDGGDAPPTLKLGELGKRISEIDISEPTGCFGRPGSQLEEKVEFKSKDGKSIWAYPVLVDFRRLLELGQVCEASGIIPGISNQDLLHAVVGLYDVCLSDMTADCIYDTITMKWARTIVLVRDMQGTVKDIAERQRIKKIREEEEAKKEKEKPEESKEEETEDSSDDDSDSDNDGTKAIPPDEDIWEEEDEVPSKFVDVYSDTEDEYEDEDDDDEEDEEEQNFTKGVRTFIRKAKRRRLDRESKEDGQILPEHVGIENMLMGCASFEKKFLCNQKERVIHLTFVGVRRRARKFQMGRYLLSKCLDPTVVGQYEAVVVHADAGAVNFFTKFGFTDDLLLNSKWSELAEQFTQCTLMCYIPGFSLTGTEMVEVTKALKGDPELGEIEEEFKKWQEKSLEAYQSQLMCMRKLQQEMLQLKTVLKTQGERMNKVLDENEKLRRSKLSAERELLTCRLESARSSFQVIASSNGDLHDDLSDKSDDEEINTEALIHSLERKARSQSEPHPLQPSHAQHRSSLQGAQSPMLFAQCEDGNYMLTGGRDRTYDHAHDVSIFSDIASRFKLGMSSDLSVRMQYEVSSIIKAVLSGSVEEKFHSRIRGMSDPSMVAQLYYCGTLEKPHRCQEVLGSGFSNDDFSHGEYGYGLYFSKYPSKAAQFSALGKLLLVQVGIGQVETVTKEDRTRKAPSPAYDSIITPGRLYRSGDTRDGPMCQEYIVFNAAQVLPVCLLTYQASTK